MNASIPPLTIVAWCLALLLLALVVVRPGIVVRFLSGGRLSSESKIIITLRILGAIALVGTSVQLILTLK